MTPPSCDVDDLWSPRRRIAEIRAATLALAFLLPACSSGWRDAPTLHADPRRVAEALSDPIPSDLTEVAGLPSLDVPSHMRPCCIFGMDLHADFAGLEVPFFELGNVIGRTDVRTHAYSLPGGAPEVETNGLVYTCRGGFIDTAHVAENADVQVFLTVSIARAIERGTTIVIPGHGAETTIVVDPIPERLLAREGAMRVASALAAWTTFRISIWHEVATWYGAEEIPGFSEQPSAFSPEDLYSNALGIRLGAAVLDAREVATEDEYARALVAYVDEALLRLDAPPVEASREVMRALDGLWWDSHRRVPELHLVLRRRFPPDDDVIAPWRAEDAFDGDSVPAVVRESCAGATPRPLTLVDHVGGVAASELVHVTWRPEAWENERFPFPDPATREVSERDLDHLVAETLHAMTEAMGTGFDAPRGEIGPHPED